MGVSKKKIRIKETPNPEKKAVVAKDPQQETDVVSWRFSTADGEYWSIFKDGAEGKTICAEIAGFLMDMESQRWSYWLTVNKKKCHEIEVEGLTKRAQKRLSDLCIEVESVLVMHLEGTHCLYGYLIRGICYVLWYDENHGDNEECVCRSFKHGDKKKHQR